jgi:hypothetical protein
MWEKHPDFFTMVEKEWKSDRDAHSVQDLLCKMERLTTALKQWNDSMFGCVKVELKRLRDDLARFRDDPLRMEPSYEEKKVTERIVELEHREETMWRQRSRVQWLAEGDKNTQKIHR